MLFKLISNLIVQMFQTYFFNTIFNSIFYESIITACQNFIKFFRNSWNQMDKKLYKQSKLFDQVIFITQKIILPMAKAKQGAVRIKDPVSEMRIFKQSVKKQKISQKIYDDFKINQPRNLDLFTPKPNNNPFLLMKYRNQGKQINGIDIEQKLNDGILKSDLDDALNTQLKSITKVPKQKWNLPQTSNQQIGWLIDRARQEGKFVHKRIGCPQTHYADNYYTMRHTSLFSNGKTKN